MVDKGKAFLLLGATAASLVALELGFRLLAPRLGVDRARLEALRDFVWTGGETAQYEPRAHVVYARPSSVPGVNRLGFLDSDFPKEKRPGVPRIACLGSSTTEGGNSLHHEGSYPYFLKQILEQRTRHPVETMNFAMAGWTTAETMVNYFLVVQDYAPDIVLIHEAVNDVEPRVWPGFRPDYSHYRRPWKELRFSLAYRLLVRFSDAFAAYQLRRVDSLGLPAVVVRPPEGPYQFAGGRLPPETAVAFRRNIRTIAEHVRLRGGQPVLVTMPYDRVRAASLPVFQAGIDDNNRILRELAKEQGFLLVDLDALVRARPDGLRPLFLDLVHLEPEGNRFKAQSIAEALLAQGLLS